MSKIEKETLKNNLTKAGRVVLDLVREVYADNINGIREEDLESTIEIGIEKTISALYDANVRDEDIISLLNKYWGISRDEAMDRVIFEKVQAPLREIRSFLQMQGLTSEEIRAFMMSNKISRKLRNNPELRKLRREPKKLLKALKVN